MEHTFACGSPQHVWTRRNVLQTLLGATVAGPGWVASSRAAQAAVSRRKQILFLWLDGAMSQFESWDPKPGTRFGGPLRSIATRLPGVHLSELMPRMAQRLDRFALVTWENGEARMRMLQPSELVRAMGGIGTHHTVAVGTRRDQIKLCGNGICSPVLEKIVRTLTGGKQKGRKSVIYKGDAFSGSSTCLLSP